MLKSTAWFLEGVISNNQNAPNLAIYLEYYKWK